MSGKWKSAIQRLQQANIRALWGGLGAALIIFIIFTLAFAKERQTASEALEAAEMAAQNDHYCQRFNFIPGTENHRSCVDEIQSLRASIQKRTDEKYSF
jgi:hypothetical protein